MNNLGESLTLLLAFCKTDKTITQDIQALSCGYDGGSEG